MNTTHPAVTRYLDELAARLSDLDPVDRAEVLAGVREHVEDSLAEQPSPTDSHVQGVLAGLGSPADVAREAYAGSGVRPSVRKVGLLDRPAVPIVAAILQAFALVLLVVFIGGGVSGVSESATMTEGPNGEVITSSRQVDFDAGASLGVPFYALIIGWPFLLAIAILVLPSSLWRRREKLLWVLQFPLSSLLLGALPALGWVLVGENGVYAGAWTALALVLLGGGWLLWTLAGRGRDRAEAMRSVGTS